MTGGTSRARAARAGEGDAAGAAGRRPLLMFDYDGVVVDSLEVFTTAFLDSCRAEHVAYPATEDEWLGLFDDNFYRAWRMHGVDDDTIRRVLGRTTRALILAGPWLRPFPLMPQALEVLGDERHVVIVTSSPLEVVERWVTRHGIAGISEIAAAESGQSKVEKIQTLVARFPGQDAYWFVGDTAGDMREARLAGVTPLGVAWGWHDPERLLGGGAEAIADTPADLLATVAPDLRADFLGLSGGAG